MGGQLLAHIYTTTTLDKAFTTLKTNYPDLVNPDGTEVFILKNPHNDGDILKKQGGMEIEINRDQLKKYFNSIIITP